MKRALFTTVAVAAIAFQWRWAAGSRIGKCVGWEGGPNTGCIW
jgi:hypothetical protein